MKIKISLLLVFLILLFGFREPESAYNPGIKKGMIKVSIFYPSGEGNTFDMDYYAGKHMPMAARLFGDSLKAMAIDKGVASGTPGIPLPYVAIGYFYFATLSSCQNVMKANAPALRTDIQNFTNSKPLIQISEVQLAE